MNVKIERTTFPADTDYAYIYYGDERIHYERVGKKTDTQRILIKVNPDCRVVVRAPETATDQEVRAAVKRRGRWIYDKLQAFREQLVDIRPRHYDSGESHLYLGKQYMLKVEVSSDLPQQVKLMRGRLNVRVSEPNPSQVKGLLDNWYKSRAKDVFHRRLVAVIDKTLWVRQPPPMRIMTMQTQWGSCSPHGRLTLNPHLVKAPRDCIDYVILHELCHIAEHNHSERFYRLMNQVMPHWRKTKLRLDNMATRLLSV